MSQSRSDRQSMPLNQFPVLNEVLRQSSEAGKGAGKKEDQEEQGMPLFWRVFGGTVLSITALVVMTVYQSLSSSVSDLRGEIGHLSSNMRKEMTRLSETQAELVKKDDCNSRMTGVWSSIKELQQDRKDLSSLKERCQALVSLSRSSAEERRTLRQELNRLREQEAVEDERRALLRELQSLRERLAGLEARQQTIKASGSASE